MSGDKPHVRGEKGPLPVNDPLSIHEIKRWRETEYNAGRPSSLKDFYSSHGICMKCSGLGASMIGWSNPVDNDEVEVAEALNLQELPLYAVCADCKGTGKSGSG